MDSNSTVLSTDNDDALTQISDPEFLKDLRAQMQHYASKKLNDATLAEDAVQEALIGALRNAGSFNRKSALKTWVFAILKNKIADSLRSRARLTDTNQRQGDDDSRFEESLFSEKGFWHPEERPVTWSEPMAEVRKKHFWRVFESCLENLPATQAQVFMMREFIGLESTQICNNLDIQTSNLHVLLYRARLRLRECLENHWYLDGENS